MSDTASTHGLDEYQRRARDERNADVVRICFGAGGVISFVGGCVAIGIGGLDARSFSALLAAGLASYAASLMIGVHWDDLGRRRRRG